MEIKFLNEAITLKACLAIEKALQRAKIEQAELDGSRGFREWRHNIHV